EHADCGDGGQGGRGLDATLRPADVRLAGDHSPARFASFSEMGGRHTGWPIVLRLCRLPILAVVVAACASARIGPVTIQTQAPTTICPAARVGGILVADPASGLAFKWSDGSVHGVVWPDGYSARREQDGVVVLID